MGRVQVDLSLAVLVRRRALPGLVGEERQYVGIGQGLAAGPNGDDGAGGALFQRRCGRGETRAT